jgi:hypothetical protein
VVIMSSRLPSHIGRNDVGHAAKRQERTWMEESESLSHSLVTIHILLQFLLAFAPVQSLALLPILCAKIDADAVDTVPLVLGVSKLLALEDVSQMPPTVVAHNLCAHHAQPAILLLAHGARHRVPECGPPAARVEFVVRLVQRRVAPAARVDTRVGVVLVVGAGAGHLGAFFAEDAELLCVVLDGMRRYGARRGACLERARLATRRPSSARGSLCCLPCCWMIRKARRGMGCWA